MKGVGLAMMRLFRLILAGLLAQTVPGWWERDQTPEVPRPNFSDDPKGFMWWLYNETAHHVPSSDSMFAWTPTSWDGWLWMGLDAMVSSLGWLIFGRSWGQVRSGMSFLIRLLAVLAICISIHYVLALCWPIVSLVVGILMTMIWLVRTVLKCCGRLVFYSQRFAGGVPEALEANFFGPELGEAPETQELRKLKKGGDSDRWVLVRRSGQTVIFKVQDSSSIKSSGLYLTMEPGTVRGDVALVDSLRGHDRVHVCRHDACSEEGPHFKQYAIAKNFSPESFQLAAATTGAQLAGSQFFGWVRAGTVKAVKRAKDLASESETEAVPCVAHRLRWEDSAGSHVLSSESCTGVGVETHLLEEDFKP